MKKLSVATRSALVIAYLCMSGISYRTSYAQDSLEDAADYPPSNIPRHTTDWIDGNHEWIIDLTYNRIFDSRAVVGVGCSGTHCSRMNLLVTGTEFKSYGLEETTWSREFPRWDGTSSGMCNGADTLMTGLSCSGTNRDCQVLNIQCSKFYGLRRDDCYWRPAFSDEGAGRDILPPQQFAAGLRCSGTSCDNVEIFACSVGSGSGTRESLSDVVKIMSVHSQQYFDVQGAGMSSGVPVVQNSLSLSSNQDFVLHPASDTNVDDAFLIRPMHSALCLEVANASMANDAGLVQSACDVRRENQHFSLRELSGGTFQIVARHSEKCIGVLNSSTTRGAQFVQSTCINGRVSHQFKFFTSY